MPQYLYIFFVFFGISFSFAQQDKLLNVENPYNIHQYTLKDGLSQVTINDIIEDENGFIWVATQDGLNRFDGTSFKSFHSNYTNKNILCGNFINTLLVDGHRIWIGSRSAGLCYFDTKDHHFFNFDILSNREVLDITKDSYNTIYATVEDKGLAVIRKNKDNKYYVQFIDFFFKKNVSITDIYISENKQIWIGTEEGRLFYGDINIDPSKINFKELHLGQKLNKIFVINSDSDKSIWVGTEKKLYQIDLQTNLILPINFNEQNKESSIIIYDLKWKNGLLWIGTGTGLFKYNSKSHQLLKVYRHNEQNFNSLSNNVINSIFIDKNNQLWVGTGKYLNLFYRNSIFHNIKHINNNKNSLNSNIIFSILKDQNDLWVGTSGGGINLIRGRNYYTFSKKSHYLPSNVCLTLISDSKNLWAGTKEGLVILYNYKKEFPEIYAKSIFNNPKDPSSLNGNFIRYIYKDQKGNIWLCTNGGGLNRFTGNLDENYISFKHYIHNPEDKESIASNKVKYITQINESTYWVGTNKGLNVLTFKDNDLNSPVFKRLKIKDSVVLNQDVIYTILKNKDSSIWVGTTKGLYFYNKDKPELKLLNQKNGLNNNVIYSILKDSQDYIWVSTNKGLSRYNKETKKFTNYNKDDGLSSEEFDLHAKFKDKSGILYFGGINGITYFDPLKIDNINKESKLYIDNIQITNSDKNIIKIHQIEENQNVRVRKKQFPFYVNFSDINLNYYKNTDFAYRLRPGDDHWNLIQNKRQIQFLNLAPGDYKLEIQGVTKGEIWKKHKALVLPITIIPIWWQSNLAYFLYFLIFLSILYLIYHFSFKRKLEHQENLRLLELDELKTRLYGNITHELRTPLTVVMGMTENIKQKINPKDLNKLKPKFNILTRNTKKLLFLINQMLDLSKIESGNMNLKLVQADIVPFIKVNLDSFHSLSANKNIELIFYNENDQIIMDFDPEKISIIISNLLSNAIKFTPENGRIILHIKKTIQNNLPNLILKIKDNGIGIKKKDQEHVFDRFYQVDATTMGGTGIGLSLTRELVLLMDGDIIVKSELDQGTEFKIDLPITNKAKELEKVTFKYLLPTDNIQEDDQYELSDNHYEDLPHILIIEDNKDVAHYIASGLIDQYEIIFAQDGEEGIEKAFDKIPDLIITDVMMPKADGFMVCDVLKNDERTSHIPVIMLTARTFERDKIKGFAHGADAYLTKPFNQNELLIRIEQLILMRKKMQKKYQKTGFLININSPKEENFINKCISAIQQNLGDENFRSAQLSFSVNLSESQLYRKLKAVTNLSTAVFIRDVRLRSAKEMLQKTDKNISEVAYSCGFSNPDWFSKSFKEKFGYTPSDFHQIN